MLAEALAEGIMTGHPAMPNFAFEPRDIGALLTFIEGLASSEPRKNGRWERLGTGDGADIDTRLGLR